MTGCLHAYHFSFPRSNALRYTLVPSSRKCRHIGMDAGIQAMDGNLTVLQVLYFVNVVALSFPSFDAVFRHPCRNDGIPAFVEKDERPGVGIPIPALQRHGRMAAAFGGGLPNFGAKRQCQFAD